MTKQARLDTIGGSKDVMDDGGNEYVIDSEVNVAQSESQFSMIFTSQICSGSVVPCKLYRPSVSVMSKYNPVTKYMMEMQDKKGRLPSQMTCHLQLLPMRIAKEPMG